MKKESAGEGIYAIFNLAVWDFRYELMMLQNEENLLTGNHPGHIILGLKEPLQGWNGRSARDFSSLLGRGINNRPWSRLCYLAGLDCAI